MMLLAAPKTVPTWMPAHRTREEYAARGLSSEIWEGNDLAEQRATAAAERAGAPRAVREQRSNTLSALALVQQVISAIQCRQILSGGSTEKRKKNGANKYSDHELPTLHHA